MSLFPETHDPTPDAGAPTLPRAGGSGTEAGTPAFLDVLLESTSRTFALTIPLLPEPTRCEVTVAYLLFRVADTLEDSTRWPPARRARELHALARLLRVPTPETAAVLASGWLADPPCDHAGYLDLLCELPGVLHVWQTLGREAREIVRAHTIRTVEGMAAFLSRDGERGVRPRDLAEVRRYCSAVAGIVGEMLTGLFLLGRRELEPIGPRLARDAAAFGEALQLVNILKDSAADLREGRRFLPERVDRAEVTSLARRDLKTAAGYFLALEGAGTARGLVAFTALPVLLAWSTLDRVERAGPGAKLARPEVAEIVAGLEQALREGSLARLWGRVTADPAAAARRTRP